MKQKDLINTVNKIYKNQKITFSDLENFITQLEIFISKIDENETEEHIKYLLRDFLKNTFYFDNTVNTKGRFDFAIHLDKTDKSKVGVIIETKAPSSKKEMISQDNLQAKSMYQCLLYYLQERINNENNDLKHIIITNFYEWFIFDATEFEKLFYENNELRKEFESWDNKKKTSRTTNLFYNEIAPKYIKQAENELQFTYFDIRNVNANIEKNKKTLVPLYKIFSPEFLLKKSFTNDSNILDKKFYYELIYIIGLEEQKIKGKKVIKRQKEKQAGSLIENTISAIEVEDRLEFVEKPEQYGKTKSEQIENIALELTIMWINRIIFLKLLESQLITYHNKNTDYKFLNYSTIADYDELNELFFEVLAQKTKDRPKNIKEKLKKIPYLNSSLFEISKLEKQTIRINSLKSRLKLPIFSKTVLNKPVGSLPILQYIFNFLDAYDFTSLNTDEIQKEQKNLINASVLGLIFEKINGYKEGSFYTPGYITMYMSRENIRRAVVQKFRIFPKFKTLEKFSELKGKIEDKKQANEIINSIKICDPAVGSGHFLVSALNEIIAIKSELGVLQYRNSNPIIDYKAEIEKDELIITNKFTEGIFEYTLNEKGNSIDYKQELQEALFHEKQTIIENCLFGVDINYNSANICRLRLWIELLKNSYYTNESNFNELETLPNIDINIKQGNSLIGRFSLNGNGHTNGQAQKMRLATEKYKEQVILYKSTNNKIVKQKTEKEILKIKQEFAQNVNPTDKDYILLQKTKYKLAEMPMLFTQAEKENWKIKTKKLTNEVAKLQSIYDKKLKTLYSNAFEWRFEFPEVLEENGNFKGFDLIIANPPYIKEMAAKSIFMPLRQSGLWDKYIEGKMDLWYFFLHKAFEISNETGIISFITNSYWVKSMGSKKLIKRIYEEKNLLEIINFNNYPIFEEVVGKHMIHSYSKLNPNKNIKYRNITKNTDFQKIEDLPFENLPFNTVVKEQEININLEQNIELKISYEKLGNLFSVSQGVVEAPDKIKKTTGVFVISEKELKNLKLNTKELNIIKKYVNTSDIKKYEINWNNQYLIFSDKITREKIANNEYPNLKKHLDKYTENITSSNRPYGLHRDRSSKENPFEPEKLICKSMFKEPEFAYDKTGLYFGFSFSTIRQKNKNYDLKFLLGLLNSNFARHWFYNNGKRRGIGVDIGVLKYREFPIPKASTKEQTEVIKIVSQIINSKRKIKESQKEENKLDKLIYKLYGLTKKEIKIVEGKK